MSRIQLGHPQQPSRESLPPAIRTQALRAYVPEPEEFSGHATTAFVSSLRAMQKRFLTEFRERFSGPVLQIPLLPYEVRVFISSNEWEPCRQPLRKVGVPSDRHLFADKSLPDGDVGASTLPRQRVVSFLDPIE